MGSRGREPFDGLDTKSQKSQALHPGGGGRRLTQLRLAQ